MKRAYDETAELRSYVWRHFNHMLTERERALHRAAILELKARGASGEAFPPTYFRRQPGYFADAEALQIAETGLSSFEQRCCDRVLRDHRGQVYINCCERCGRIVASPIACACTWCGHHWYERRAEMIARATSPIYPEQR